MGEAAARNPVLSGARAGSARVSITVAPPASRLSLRARADAVAGLSKALGVKLPVKPATSAEGNGIVALWLGPDEWLLIAADGTDLAALAGKAKVLHSAVDISHRNAALVVEGQGAADIINSGCPRDLSLAAFPVGACSRTVLGKAEIILMRESEQRFRIEAWRSFAQYVFDHLEEAARLDA